MPKKNVGLFCCPGKINSVHFLLVLSSLGKLKRNHFHSHPKKHCLGAIYNLDNQTSAVVQGRTKTLRAWQCQEIRHGVTPLGAHVSEQSDIRNARFLTIKCGNVAASQLYVGEAKVSISREENVCTLYIAITTFLIFFFFPP